MKKLIIKPLISEKQVSRTSQNCYVFYVNSNANKKEIKEAIEKIYQVKVILVRTSRVRKAHRLGKTLLSKLISLKKAEVKLAKGSSIPDLIIKEESKESAKKEKKEEKKETK